TTNFCLSWDDKCDQWSSEKYQAEVVSTGKVTQVAANITLEVFRVKSTMLLLSSTDESAQDEIGKPRDSKYIS
ncbi:MAG: hypothetical protein J7501_16075, partial [Bdellovibrio sp.]|nr:hypothetical protein [Bdellovibrio sp.]